MGMTMSLLSSFFRASIKGAYDPNTTSVTSLVIIPMMAPRLPLLAPSRPPYQRPPTPTTLPHLSQPVPCLTFDGNDSRSYGGGTFAACHLEDGRRRGRSISLPFHLKDCTSGGVLCMKGGRTHTARSVSTVPESPPRLLACRLNSSCRWQTSWQGPPTCDRRRARDRSCPGDRCGARDPSCPCSPPCTHKQPPPHRHSFSVPSMRPRDYRSMSNNAPYSPIIPTCDRDAGSSTPIVA